MKIRVVYDCMVFLQGAAKKSGPAAACLRLAEEGAVSLFISSEIVTELRDVLSRPKTQRRFPSLTTDRVDALLTAWNRQALLVEPPALDASYCRDPKDEKYIRLAVASGASYIVSRDRDLLDLMGDDVSAVEFRREFPSITIIEPPGFLKVKANS